MKGGVSHMLDLSGVQLRIFSSRIDDLLTAADYVTSALKSPPLFPTHASPSQPTALHTYMHPWRGNTGLTPAHRSVDARELLHAIFQLSPTQIRRAFARLSAQRYREFRRRRPS
jgi:hypothetical protein